jgi:hypothetical protein
VGWDTGFEVLLEYIALVPFSKRVEALTRLERLKIEFQKPLFQFQMIAAVFGVYTGVFKK